jgi:hypothetical protein
VSALRSVRGRLPRKRDSKQLNLVCRIEAAGRGGNISRRYAKDTAGLSRLLPDAPGNPFRLLHVLQTGPGDVRWYFNLPHDPPKAEVVLFLSFVGMSRPDRMVTLMDVLTAAGIDFVAIAVTMWKKRAQSAADA